MFRVALVLLVIPSVCLAGIRFGTLPVSKSVPAPAVHADVSGLHSHWCAKCKIEWWHGAENFGSAKAHSCPKCGSVVYEVHQQSRAKPAVKAQAFQSFQGCPGGVCPTNRRLFRK